MGPRARLDSGGKSRPTGIRSPDRPACSQSLYRLSYLAHFYLFVLYDFKQETFVVLLFIWTVNIEFRVIMDILSASVIKIQK